MFEWNLNAVKCYEKVGFVKKQVFTDTDNPKWNSIQMILEKDNS